MMNIIPLPRRRALFLGRPFLLAALLASAGHAAAQPQQPAPPVTMRALTETHDLGGVSVSPDARRAVVAQQVPSTADNSLSWYWWIVPLDGAGVPSRIGAAETPFAEVGNFLPSAEAPVWSADSAWFYYRLLRKDEVQLWRTSADGARSEQLTFADGDVERFRFDRSGRNLLVEVGPDRASRLEAERREAEYGVLIDKDVMVHDTLNRAIDYRGQKVTIRRALDGSHLLGDRQMRLMVTDRAGGAMRLATATEKAEFDTAVGDALAADPGAQHTEISPDHGRIAFLKRESKAASARDDMFELPRFRVSWTADRSSKVAKSCADPACYDPVGRITRLRWHRDPVTKADQILFIGREPSGATTLYAWDIARDTVRRVAHSAGLLSAGTGAEMFGTGICPIAAGRAICVTADANEPPRLESIAIATGEHKVLLDTNAAIRAAVHANHVEHLSWKDQWGRAQTGVLVMASAADRNLPLVISSYRCNGFIRGGTGQEMPEHVLAQRGFAVLCVNLDPQHEWVPHPSGKYPDATVHSYRNMMEAYESGIDALAARGLVDPKRVGLSGLSFGSIATHYTLFNSNRFAAAAAPPNDTDPGGFDYYGIPGSIFDDINRRHRKLPDPRNDPEGKWKAVSPALNVDRIKTPLLVQAAEAEFRLELDLFVSMRRAGKPMEMIVYPDEPHIFRQPIHRLHLYERNVDWFAFWLKGEEDPDPAKQDQYRRWRALREEAAKAGPA